MKVRKTFYLEDTTAELLDELKMNKKFKTMDQLLLYLVTNEGNEIEDNTTEKTNLEKKIAFMDKNIEMLLEIATWMADKTNNIPTVSYREGWNTSYKKTKELVEKNIDSAQRNNSENSFFE